MGGVRETYWWLLMPAAWSASNVGVNLKDSGAFTKGEEGAWYGTTRPLDEGFHYHTIKIDGADRPDSSRLMYFEPMRWGSAVELPAHNQDFYTIEHVVHGQLREIFFHSPGTKSERRAFVYTPHDQPDRTAATRETTVGPDGAFKLTFEPAGGVVLSSTPP